MTMEQDKQIASSPLIMQRGRAARNLEATLPGDPGGMTMEQSENQAE